MLNNKTLIQKHFFNKENDFLFPSWNKEPNNNNNKGLYIPILSHTLKDKFSMKKGILLHFLAPEQSETLNLTNENTVPIKCNTYPCDIAVQDSITDVYDTSPCNALL